MTAPIIIFSWLFAAVGLADTATLQGVDLFTEKTVTVTAAAADKKGLVVTFLSASCPCSDSHIAELLSLHKEHPEFSFVGVHSNTDESKEQTLSYFAKVKLPFPVIRDSNAKIADEFKALKTPHSFVILPDGTTAYSGGVSSSKTLAKAERKYLREALGSLAAGRAVDSPLGRTLGCVIKRGGAHAW